MEIQYLLTTLLTLQINTEARLIITTLSIIRTLTMCRIMMMVNRSYIITMEQFSTLVRQMIEQ